MEFVLLDDLSFLHMLRGDEAEARKADREAEQRLAAIAEAMRAGRLEDSLLLDFRQLAKLRYLNQPSMLSDPFLGVLDQVVVRPPAAAGAR
jgi:hypothetical protein